jgi:hypothetical protein
MSRSRYDELHDKYDAILTTKSGTRYERLAAMVFKALGESTAVIHDVSLLGESDVPHQIAVHVTVEGQSRRVLIECKDFDISGRKVGLPIVRNFCAVLDDTKADEGLYLPATASRMRQRNMPKRREIKLAVLRVHEEKDWEGYIKTAVVRLLALTPADPTMIISVFDDAERQRFENATPSLSRPGGIADVDPVFMVKNQDHMNKAIPLKNVPDRANVRVENDGWKIEIRG